MYVNLITVYRVHNCFCFNLYEFGYWSVILCIYCDTLNNSYCTGELHFAEMPWRFILVLKYLWRNSVTKSNCDATQFVTDPTQFPSQSSKKSSRPTICLKLWRKFPSQFPSQFLTVTKYLWWKKFCHKCRSQFPSQSALFRHNFLIFPSQFVHFPVVIENYCIILKRLQTQRIFINYFVYYALYLQKSHLKFNWQKWYW